MFLRHFASTNMGNIWEMLFFFFSKMKEVLLMIEGLISYCCLGMKKKCTDGSFNMGGEGSGSLAL